MALVCALGRESYCLAAVADVPIVPLVPLPQSNVGSAADTLRNYPVHGVQDILSAAPSEQRNMLMMAVASATGSLETGKSYSYGWCASMLRMARPVPPVIAPESSSSSAQFCCADLSMWWLSCEREHCYPGEPRSQLSLR